MLARGGTSRAGILRARRFDFDIQLVSGKGATFAERKHRYSMRSKGAGPEVRARPPYPSEHGLFGQPTLVNNVETLASIPWIARRGGEAYAGTRILGQPRHEGPLPQFSLHEAGVVRGRIRRDGPTTSSRLSAGASSQGTIKGLIIGGPARGRSCLPHLFDIAARLRGTAGHRRQRRSRRRRRHSTSTRQSPS